MTPTDELRLPPPEAKALIVIVYPPLARTVGSNVARVAGGVPVPEASTIGLPESPVRPYSTFQLPMVWPAGGVRDAVIGVGAGISAPSAGLTPPIAGGVPVPEPPLGFDQLIPTWSEMTLAPP